MITELSKLYFMTLLRMFHAGQNKNTHTHMQIDERKGNSQVCVMHDLGNWASGLAGTEAVGTLCFSFLDSRDLLRLANKAAS